MKGRTFNVHFAFSTVPNKNIMFVNASQQLYTLTPTMKERHRGFSTWSHYRDHWLLLLCLPVVIDHCSLRVTITRPWNLDLLTSWERVTQYFCSNIGRAEFDFLSHPLTGYPSEQHSTLDEARDECVLFVSLIESTYIFIIHSNWTNFSCQQMLKMWRSLGIECICAKKFRRLIFVGWTTLRTLGCFFFFLVFPTSLPCPT